MPLPAGLVCRDCCEKMSFAWSATSDICSECDMANEVADEILYRLTEICPALVIITGAPAGGMKDVVKAIIRSYY